MNIDGLESVYRYGVWKSCVLGLVLGMGASTGASAQQSAELPPSYAPPPTVKLTTWSFNSVNGAAPMGGVMIDSAGNLVGTTSGGGANGDGEVFMIAKTATGFAKTPSVIASFNGTNGQTPTGGLIADSSGNLFGTTQSGGNVDIYGNYGGVVFEIMRSSGIYGKSVKILAKLGNLTKIGDALDEPIGSLAMDSMGNLFGAADFAAQNFAILKGGVFELKKSGSAYVTSATPIVMFDGNNGGLPEAGLVKASNGNLLGTTSQYGTLKEPGWGGTAFEILKTATGYNNSATTLHNFGYASDGALPMANPSFDSKGNIFGTTSEGGANFTGGTVFELIKVGAGYTYKSLINLPDSGPGPFGPEGGVIIDAAGNLFGATWAGGHNYDGTVFKIAKTATGYATTATVLVTFNGANGQQPQGNLVADSSGNLFGTTNAGGVNGQGEVFEVSGSGFVVK